MDKNEIKKMFNRLAKEWDTHQGDCSKEAERIFAALGDLQGRDVLDVACGTGILVKEYLKRGVATLDCIDIAEEMIAVAQRKYDTFPVHFIVGDAQNYPFKRKYDLIMIFNAFPHFYDTEELFAHLTSFLKEGGLLCIAHSMSRDEINEIHHPDGIVSCMLPEIEALKEQAGKYLKVIHTVSNDSIYQLIGRKE